MDEPLNSDLGERIACDMPCVSCGYNLRTLAVSGLCPECGDPVLKSARHALVYADREWLKTLRDGATILAWATVATFGCTVLSLVFAAIGARLRIRGISDGSLIFAGLTAMAGFCAVAVGAAKLTEGEPGAPRIRWWSIPGMVRTCLVGLFVFLSLAMVSLKSWAHAALIVSTLLVLVTLLAVHTKRLARRGEPGGVARLATATAWVGGTSLALVTTCLAIGGGVALLLPTYRGTGWAITQIGLACLSPVAFLVLGVLTTVLMFRARGMFNRLLAAAPLPTDARSPPERH